jgi:hypothetical protein
MKGGEIKIKYANGGKRAENEMWDNYRFILSMRASHFRSVSKTIFIHEDLGHWCDWRTCHSRRDILDASRKIHRKILGCAELLIRCQHSATFYFTTEGIFSCALAAPPRILPFSSL